MSYQQSFGGGGGSGDVSGPGSSTDNALVRFDGTAGKTLQNSDAILDDNGKLTITQRIITGVNRETLSADKTLVATDVQSHYLDPNGSDRDVNLYSSPSTGDYHVIKNIGSANTLTVKNSGGTTLTVLSISIAAGFEYDGTDWQLV